MHRTHATQHFIHQHQTKVNRESISKHGSHVDHFPLQSEGVLCVCTLACPRTKTIS
jgi:hypothetical protein